MTMQRRVKRPAFTLTDLIALMTLAAAALSFLAPALLSAQGAAERRQTMNCLKIMGLAIHNTNDTYRRLPPAFGKLGQLEDPNFSVPSMTAVVVWPGATAQQIQDELLNRMEKKFEQLDNFEKVKTYARQG